MSNFTSDNVSPVCDSIMAAISAANSDHVPSYGGDPLTQRLTQSMREVFETDLAVFPVATGTAANALALSQLSPPYGAIYCYDAAHIVTDECGAPEFFTGGAKLIGLPAADGRISAAQIASAIGFANEMGVHHVKPGAISITQATEWGTVYENAQISDIAELARSNQLQVHMDGARFANALVHLDCTPAQATWKSGVDVLSFGATKNGAMCAEAVIFFNPQAVQDFDRRRKRAGHLWSKLRFVSAQLLAYLDNELWLANARNANHMAGRLAKGLQQISCVRLLHAVQANEVFVAMPEQLVAALEQAGFQFYRWPLYALPTEVAIRLVTSYATQGTEIDAFLAAARRLA